jgi:hypothetical protein
MAAGIGVDMLEMRAWSADQEATSFLKRVIH